MRFSSIARLVAALALLVAPVTGCDARVLKVRLPGFGSGAIDGIWLWRLESGSYRRVCRFDLSDPYLSGDREVLVFWQSCSDGRPESQPWQATVERLSSDPSTVTLALLYQANGPLTPHRATSFNAAGESALSSTSLSL